MEFSSHIPSAAAVAKSDETIHHNKEENKLEQNNDIKPIFLIWNISLIAVIDYGNCSA